jgi:hypothetical protein
MCQSFAFEFLGLDTAVGIVTRHWLGGPGIESRWGREFRSLWPTHPSIQCVLALITHPHLAPGLNKECCVFMGRYR